MTTENSEVGTVRSPSTPVLVLLLVLTVLFSPVGIVAGIVYLVKGRRGPGLALLILGAALFVLGILLIHR